MSNLTIIVAMTEEGGIGINNTIPWKLREDMAHFKKTTTGHPVIMGRKTYESIGRPLPNRRNIVITHNLMWKAEGVEVFHSLSEAIDAVDEDKAFIIGGAEVYAAAFPVVDKLIITQIHHTFCCDTFFPAIDSEKWKRVAMDTAYSEANDWYYSISAFVTRG